MRHTDSIDSRSLSLSPSSHCTTFTQLLGLPFAPGALQFAEAETAEQLFYSFRAISLQFRCIIHRMMLATVLGILIFIKPMTLLVGGESLGDSVVRGELVDVQRCCQVQISSISSFQFLIEYSGGWMTAVTSRQSPSCSMLSYKRRLLRDVQIRAKVCGTCRAHVYSRDISNPRRREMRPSTRFAP